MNMNDQFGTELERLVSAGSGVAVARQHGRCLRGELAQVGPLGCQLTYLALETDALANAEIDHLKRVSEAIASRLTYLMERIGPIEVDAQRCTVQMRSQPPQQDDDGTRYYELMVRRGGEISLCRYQKTPGEPRRSIPAALTKEVLLRLVDDLLQATG